MEKLSAFLLLVSAGLAVVIVLAATYFFYAGFGPEGQFVSLLVTFGGFVALASLTASTFRTFLQPALKNGAHRVRKRNP